MKVKNIKINVIVDEYGERTLMTVEDEFKIKNLREQKDFPKGCEFYCNWFKVTDDCIMEDWDLIEVRYDLTTILSKMEKEIGEMKTIMTELGYIK